MEGNAKYQISVAEILRGYLKAAKCIFSTKKKLGQVQQNNYQPLLVTFHLHNDTVQNIEVRKTPWNSDNDVAVVFARQTDDVMAK